MIGNFLEEFFSEDLMSLSRELGYYCDHKGPRPGVRGNLRKLTWIDNKENKHDLDYVFEKDGSPSRRGLPVAFIELAWRRYTKHSRNKSGEIESALIHLRESYQTCRFLGAILAGEYTEGGKNELTSRGINVLHITFATLADAFRSQGLDIDYPENAESNTKQSVIDRWQALTPHEISTVKERLTSFLSTDYSAFKERLRASLSRTVQSVVVFPLYGNHLVFPSIQEAVAALDRLDTQLSTGEPFIKFEVQIQFSNGDRVEGTFHNKAEALQFLAMFS